MQRRHHHVTGHPHHHLRHLSHPLLRRLHQDLPPVLDVLLKRVNDGRQKGQPHESIEEQVPYVMYFKFEREENITKADSGERDHPVVKFCDERSRWRHPFIVEDDKHHVEGVHESQ